MICVCSALLNAFLGQYVEPQSESQPTCDDTSRAQVHESQSDNSWRRALSKKQEFLNGLKVSSQ